MDSSLNLQMEIKNNARELQFYMLDLANWEAEMKEKEVALNNEIPHQNDIPPPRNKIKRSNTNEKNSNKPKKISAYDYSAWEKFDVDKACAAVDEDEQTNKIETITETEESKDSSDEESDEKKAEKMSLIDEAFYHKELGNSFVKKGEWSEAIKCYTSAINIDSENPIFYANRSLCFLKLKNFKSAETDATAAVQLDYNYVKAYQRRAFARLGLGQLREAKSDFQEVLRIEPKSALASLEIDKIDRKLEKESKTIKGVTEKKTFDFKHIFKTQETSPKTSSIIATPKIDPVNTNESVKLVKDTSESTSSTIDESEPKIKESSDGDDGGDGDKPSSSQSSTKKSEVFKPLPDWCKIVHPIKKAPHQRSKKPLRKVDIILVNEVEDTDDPTSKTITPTETESKKEEVRSVTPSTPSEDEIYEAERLSLQVPKTSIQFQNCWKVLKRSPERAYLYLKQIPKDGLSVIFENSLESDLFSDLIAFLACDEVKKDPELIYSFLVDLSHVKRFTSLILFMSQADKTYLKQCFSEIKGCKTEDEVSELLKLYELELK